MGVAPAEPFTRARRVIEERKAAGLNGSMNFTYKNPARSTDPHAALSGARSIVVGAFGYGAATSSIMSSPEAGAAAAGTIARYAQADHYRMLRDALEVVGRRLRTDGWKTRIFVDDNSLVDREAAYLAGIGWYGKNANLLLPGMGSWFVLGSIVTDAPLPPNDRRVDDGCGPCRRCLDRCPTGAIIAPGVIDARRCLSWILQAPGVVPREFRVAVGNRIYGCDDCQDVCPKNSGVERDHETEAGSPGAYVELLEMLAADDETLLARFGRFYLWQREVRYLRRNALVALGNVGDGRDPAVATTLTTWLRCSDPLVRAHAVWAAGQLNRLDLVPIADGEDAREVRDEMNALGL